MQLIMRKMEDCKNFKSVYMVTILQITCSLTKLMFLQNGDSGPYKTRVTPAPLNCHENELV